LGGNGDDKLLTTPLIWEAAVGGKKAAFAKMGFQLGRKQGQGGFKEKKGKGLGRKKTGAGVKKSETQEVAGTPGREKGPGLGRGAITGTGGLT